MSYYSNRSPNLVAVLGDSLEASLYLDTKNRNLSARSQVADDGSKIEGCPHLHPTHDEALACPEARVTIADITGLPLPEVLND